MNARVACANIIASVLRHEASLNTLLPQYLEKVAANERAMLQELCYGTLRWYPALTVIIEALVAKPLKEKDIEITALLAAGLYQLREMRTPSHAAVNESVSACKALKRPWAKGLVNGVLRRFLREQDSLIESCKADPRFISAHPLWIQQRLKAAWPQQLDVIYNANNTRPPFTLRVNQRCTSRHAYLALLDKAQLPARPAPFSDCGIYLESAVNVEELPHFSDGWVSVQDEAAQLCAPLLSLKPGERVLDACSAPGGKTCHMLESEPGLNTLIALDIDKSRLARVKENLQRLQLSASLQAADAADIDGWWDGESFDAILLDAPCSGSGVIRRHPDIKLLRKPADIDKLAGIQGQLLANLWTVLKTGGRLLYTTCSVFPEENDQVISTFVDCQPDCQPVPIRLSWGIKTKYGCQLLPTNDSHDGFYYALLTKG